MNDSLIKQLELAIQVESGEVDQMEVQYREKGHEVWTSPTSPSARGWAWRFEEYEYRRKPKPLERWMNLDSGGTEEFFKSEEVAKRNADMRTKMAEDTGLGYAITRIAVHMREVTND